MRKKILLLSLFIGIFFLFTTTSAQFTPTTCEGQAHCSAPTPGVNYKNFIIYLGEQGEEFDLGFQQNFDKKRTLLKEIFISENKNFSEEEILTKIQDNIPDIQASKILIINTSKFDVLLQILGELHASENLNLKDKTIYLVTNSNKFFLKRILSKYIKPIEITKIYTLSQNKLLNFLSTLSLDKITNEEEYITPFSLSFHETPKYLAISYLVDRLIYHGFPIELITMFLVLSLGTLLVSILRQVVGFSIFGVYSPLLFAISLSILGIPFSLALLAIGLVAKLILRLFTKRMYLLHNAKTSLLILLYFFLMLLIFGLNSIFGLNLIDPQLFANGYIIFPMIFIILVSDKVFNEGFKPFSLGRRIAFAEFLIVSFAVYGLFYRTGLKHLLLAFPELLILIFVLNIAVGRFTGLQLLEYFRFMPLIKKSSESEEEEEE
ncbi:MAG TPA: 7TM domain-containing protein, partial [Candidatus Absconditabacterales bacterium]|nr:7TM domain-containing protein [Candidatus Absconditabacterales bacterium]